MAEHLPAHGKGGKNCLALLVSGAFALLINLSLSQPMSFPTFILLILSMILLMGDEHVAAQGLALAGVKPQLRS